MSLALLGDVDSFIDEILACCPMIRSIWLVADCLNAGPHRPRLYTWDLVALADPLSLQRLRRSLKPPRGDVRLRVISYANRLESPWQGPRRDGVLLASEWEECNPGEGYYTESSAPVGAILGAVKRTRRKAVCLWQGIDPLTAPGS